MRKIEIARVVSAKTGVTVKDTIAVINGLFDEIENGLSAGETVNLRGFATLQSKMVKGHKGGGLKAIKGKILPDYLRIKILVSPGLKARIRSKYDPS